MVSLISSPRFAPQMATVYCALVLGLVAGELSKTAVAQPAIARRADSRQCFPSAASREVRSK